MSHHSMQADASLRHRSKLAHQIWLLGRRRRFIVPGPYQVRSILNISALAVVLITAFNIVFYELIKMQSAQAVQVAPELAHVIRGQDGYQMELMVLGSIVAFLGIVATVLFETHKTAGPLFNLVQTMQKLSDQGPSVRVRFRKEDHFREVEAAFNAMATSLEAQSLRRGEELVRMSEAIRREAESLAAGGASTGEIVSRLNALAADLAQIEREPRPGQLASRL